MTVCLSSTMLTTTTTCRFRISLFQCVPISFLLFSFFRHCFIASAFPLIHHILTTSRFSALCSQFLLTNLVRGNARLSALRVISLLSDWPTALHAMFLGDITEPLFLISSEAEELASQKAKKAQAKVDSSRSTPSSTAVPPKPKRVERGVSFGSASSSTPGSTSGRSTSSTGDTRSLMDIFGISPISSSPTHQNRADSIGSSLQVCMI